MQTAIHSWTWTLIIHMLLNSSSSVWSITVTSVIFLVIFSINVITILPTHHSNFPYFYRGNKTFTLFLILECELVGGSESCFPLNLQGQESYRACSPIGLVSSQEETPELTHAFCLSLSLSLSVSLCLSLSACKVMWHKQKVPSTSQEENLHQHQHC